MTFDIMRFALSRWMNLILVRGLYWEADSYLGAYKFRALRDSKAHIRVHKIPTLTLSRASEIQPTHSRHISIRCITILSSHLSLGLLRDLFLEIFRSKFCVQWII